ncbi:MAG: hypothetical protein D6767_06815 [Candidatus Hydrogenedentota bacterium]|nr:MAG: hypothetical protein D6767_06815 [Candidatus Hydrogenedentota bacterium]
MADNDKQEARSGNVLRIGISTLQELEEKIKAFRTINLNAKKKRFILARETIKDNMGNILVSKGEEITLPVVLQMRRFYKPDHVFKTFQPDEGIALISDMSTPAGIQLSMDLVTQIMNIGGGAYEAFIDRVDSIKELSQLLAKALFPKLVIIGYIPPERVREEIAYYQIIKKADPYIRIIEIQHSTIKPTPIIPKIKHLQIIAEDKESWVRFILDIIQEYTKPYSIEER